jgi:hypothetical protein
LQNLFESIGELGPSDENVKTFEETQIFGGKERKRKSHVI